METAIIAGVIGVVVFLLFVAVAAKKEESNTTSTISNKPTPQEIQGDIETLRKSEQNLDMVRASLDDIQRKVNVTSRMQKTNNLYALLSIYNDILEQYGWTEKKGQDRFVDTGADEDYLSYLNCITNENILRIAINLCRVAFEKCWEVKTMKGKQNKLTACFDDINMCISELKEHENKLQIINSLNDLYAQVEDNISSLLRNEPMKIFNPNN